MKKKIFVKTALCILIATELVYADKNTLSELSLGLKRTPVSAKTNIHIVEPEKPRVTLALSGGGARGLAQIGVLKVLEKEQILLHGIAGTSIGALVGGLYAMGYTAAEIERLAIGINWDTIIDDRPDLQQLFLEQKSDRFNHVIQLRFRGINLEMPDSYTAGQNLQSILTKWALNSPYPFSGNFDQYHTNFLAVATDMVSGKKQVISNGSIVDAMRASMAIPLLFSPVRKNGNLLVDGGLVQNLPVDEARSLDSDIVIALDTSTKLRDISSLSIPWLIADQVTTIMQQDQLNRQFESADIGIRPDIEGFSNTDFSEAAEIIKRGEQAALAAVPKIKDMIKKAEKVAECTEKFEVDSLIFSGFTRQMTEQFKSCLYDNSNGYVRFSAIKNAAHKLIKNHQAMDIRAYLDSTSSIILLKAEPAQILNEIHLYNNNALPDSTLIKPFKNLTGKVLNPQFLKNALKNCIKIYKNENMGLAVIDSVWLKNNDLHISFNEGIINEISVKGLKKTKPFVINREILNQTGLPFNSDNAIAEINNIYSTGFFHEAGITAALANGGYNLKYHVRERHSTIFRMGGRYDTERRGSGFVQLAEENLLGSGAQGSILGLVGKNDLKFGVSLWTNRIMYSNFTGQLDYEYSNKKYDYYINYSFAGSYTIKESTGAITAGQSMRRLGMLSLGLSYKNTLIIPEENTDIQNGQIQLININLRSEVDTRNEYPFPSSGRHHILEYQLSSGLNDKNIRFYKLWSMLDSYYPLSKRIVFQSRLHWGTSDPSTPFTEQFRIGGYDSFLALPAYSLNGKRFISINSQLRLKLPWIRRMPLYFSIRYDVAGIWERYSRIQSEDFEDCFGIIFSIQSILGPVHAAWARTGSGISRFYLSIGHAF